MCEAQAGETDSLTKVDHIYTQSGWRDTGANSEDNNKEDKQWKFNLDFSK